VKPDPEWASGHRTGRGRRRRHLRGGHFGPNLATNPNVTHPGHRPPGTNETKRKIETAEESTS
jgi:hypothetical protein